MKTLLENCEAASKTASFCGRLRLEAARNTAVAAPRAAVGEPVRADAGSAPSRTTPAGVENQDASRRGGSHANSCNRNRYFLQEHSFLDRLLRSFRRSL